jgi:hypothetical protein
MFPSRPGFAEVFLGVVIVGAFLYGTYEMNRGGARAVQFNSLRERVLKHVDAHPNKAMFTLQDLQDAGVLSAEDVQFMEDNGITYHPLGAMSPKQTLCFVQRRGTEETRYYKDAISEYRRMWVSPNNSLAIVKAPKIRGANEETISVTEVATGKPLAAWDIGEASANNGYWSDDSRFGAVTLHRYGKDPFVHYINCGILFQVTAQGLERIEVPDELRPNHLLPTKHAGKQVRWHDNWVMPQGWRGRELSVESQGIGRIVSGNGTPDYSFNVIYRFTLNIADGKAVISRKAQRHYAETPIK